MNILSAFPMADRIKFLLVLYGLFLSACVVMGNTGIKYEINSEKEQVDIQISDVKDKVDMMNNMNKPCLLCKSIFKPRIIMLEEVLNNNTQSSHLQQLCISGGVSSEKCMVMISTLKEQIHAEVKLLYRLQNCPEICLNDDALNDVIKLSNESFVCEMCKDISGLIEDTVTGAMKIAIDFMSHLCHQLVPPTDQACEDFVEKPVIAIADILEALFNPRLACKPVC